LGQTWSEHPHQTLTHRLPQRYPRINAHPDPRCRIVAFAIAGCAGDLVHLSHLAGELCGT
jgi:hypothetical protein